MDAKELASIIKDYADRREAPLLKRIEALEQSRTMRFVGPHDPSKYYKSGDVVQRAGSVFVAMVDSTAKPGESSDWRRIASDRS
jgi:hypothetical protein